MHRSGQRRPDRSRAGFFGQQHGREYDDKNWANIREHDLHREGEIAPRVRAGRAAEPSGDEVSQNSH